MNRKIGMAKGYQAFKSLLYDKKGLKINIKSKKATTGNKNRYKKPSV